MKKSKETKKTEKKSTFEDWKKFWKSLEAGPRGAMIGFGIAVTAIFIVYIVPLIIKVLAVIFAVLLSTLFGTVIGSLIGWLYHVWQKHRGKKR